MSNSINFTVRTAFPGSEKQKAIGIYGTFNMTIDGPDGIIVSLNDMKLMKSKEGKYYIRSAFRTYDTQNEKGETVPRRIEYAKFWPEQQNWDKQQVIVDAVLSALEQKGNDNRANSSNNSSNYQKSERATPASTPASNDPW